MAEAALDPAVNASREERIPGNRGIWVGITCIFIEFAMMFAIYFIARAHYPEAFHEGPGRLSDAAGTVITLLMVTSSYFIACSVNAIGRGRSRSAIMWLLAGLLVALLYPLMKYIEVSWNLEHGIGGEAGIFFTIYYYLTLNHLVHASWGILGMLFVLARLVFGGYSAEEYSGMVALASYWHATDIIWLIIFPLFYVLA